MLRGAESRLHIVEGLAVAQQHMDQVVKTIRAAPDSASAGSQLQSDFGLSTEQVLFGPVTCPALHSRGSCPAQS